MGYHKIKRPILAPGVAISSGGFAGATGPATVSGDLDVSGDLRAAGTLTPSAGLVENVQTVSSTGTTVLGYGLSILTAGGSTTDKTYKLAAPAASGIHKYIVSNATGAQKISVVNSATANTFMATTSGTIVFSTNSTKQRSVHLVAVSTSKWYIVARSTGTTLTG